MMKRLANGLIFGLGLGLITTALDGLTNNHSMSTLILGIILLSAAGGLVLYRPT